MGGHRARRQHCKAGNHRQGLEKCLAPLGETGPFPALLGPQRLRPPGSPSRRRPGGGSPPAPLPEVGAARHLAPRVSGNENTAGRLFILGSEGSVFTSRPGTRTPAPAQAMKNGFVEGSAEAAPWLPAKTSAVGETRPSRERASHRPQAPRARRGAGQGGLRCAQRRTERGRLPPLARASRSDLVHSCCLAWASWTPLGGQAKGGGRPRLTLKVDEDLAAEGSPKGHQLAGMGPQMPGTWGQSPQEPLPPVPSRSLSGHFPVPAPGAP